MGATSGGFSGEAGQIGAAFFSADIDNLDQNTVQNRDRGKIPIPESRQTVIRSARIKRNLYSLRDTTTG